MKKLITILLLAYVFVFVLSCGMKHEPGTHLYIIETAEGSNTFSHMADSIVHQSDRCITFITPGGYTESVCSDYISVSTLY